MQRAWAIWCLVGLTGCPSIGSYQCMRDEDCNRGGAEGRCLADAACAYPEESGRCESGWARSPNAADSPGACIETEPPATSDGSSGGPTSSATLATGTDESDSSTLDPASTGGGTPCVAAQVSIDTATISPNQGLENYVLWLPFDVWPKGAARLTEEGHGLRITDASGNLVHHEQRALLDGTPALWVRLPTFVADETVALEFTFGPGIETPEPAPVWDADFLGVWHLDDAPMGLDGDLSRNSAAPDQPGVLSGSMTPEQQSAGPLGPATEFDGDDDIMTIDAPFVGQLNAYTISMWARTDNAVPDSRGSFFQRLNGNYFYPRCWHGATKSGGLFCQHSVGDSTVSTSTEDLPIGEFFHMAVIRDADAAVTTVYLDGEVARTFSDNGGSLDSDPELVPLEIGHGEWGTLLGAIDEVRVSDHPLSADRVRADYRSQSGQLQPATFGELEPADCPQ